ncbi:Hypothetical protein POVR1_LOCUS495 [uncultured virus]|nr:Hypothetical protein POVR1_LOCUS495 [uncultured virus]
MNRARNGEGFTLSSKPDQLRLVEAINDGNVNAFERLMMDGVDPSLNEQNAICQAALSNADECDKIMERLLHDRRVIATARNNFPLRHAARLGYKTRVKLLVQHGADVTSCNNFALRMAVKNSHVDVVRFLQKQSSVDLKVHNYEVLREAIENENTDILSMLLQHPKLSIKKINADQTIIRSAVTRLNPKIISLLVNAGVRLWHDDQTIRKVRKSNDVDLIEVFASVL